jgi:hypothetical protein
MITHIGDSPRLNKRYRVTLDDGRKYDFGSKYGSTYLDHQNQQLRDAYWKRHYVNRTERELIDNLVPSPALLSAYILWGPSTDLEYNIRFLNNLWAQRKENSHQT